jgi:hypothetical protein
MRRARPEGFEAKRGAARQTSAPARQREAQGGTPRGARQTRKQGTQPTAWARTRKYGSRRLALTAAMMEYVCARACRRPRARALSARSAAAPATRAAFSSADCRPHRVERPGDPQPLARRHAAPAEPHGCRARAALGGGQSVRGAQLANEGDPLATKAVAAPRPYRRRSRWDGAYMMTVLARRCARTWRRNAAWSAAAEYNCTG